MSPLRTTTDPDHPDPPGQEGPAAGDGLERPNLDSHLIGEYSTGRPGPLIIFVGGVHGNEPAGVLALQEVLEDLRARSRPLRGRLVCLAGNLEALRQGQRYIERDLNRVWAHGDTRPEELADLHEARVREEMEKLIEIEIAGVSGPVILVDLHSTSAGGSPFSIIGDTRQNRRIAMAMPVPVILGLEESVDGALLGFFGERGHVAVGFEGGQHDDPATIRNHVAAIWLSLVSGGSLARSKTPEAIAAYNLLRAAGRGNPGVIELRYRHHVEAEDEFVMREGFSNFDPVSEGDLLAKDISGPIYSREDGLMLLPLYQGQGQDGFFIGREVRRFWLRVSSCLRVLRLGALIHLMPGVHQVDGEVETLEVDPAVARWWVVEVFHLLGFRRVRSVGGKLRFSRRVESVPIRGR